MGAGRKSKLTDSQWAEIAQRVHQGEGVRPLGREFGISEGCIRGKLKRLDLPDLAKQKAAAELTRVQIERKIGALPKAAQQTVNSLAQQLIEVSQSLATAAGFSAQTTAIFAGIARAQAEKIDPVDPTGPDSMKALQDAVNLQKAANLSSEIPLGLLAANKAAIERMNAPEDIDGADLLRKIADELPE